MRVPVLVAAALAAVACGGGASATTSPRAPTYAREAHVIAGTFAPGRSPDGNSVFLDAPRGLVVVDTGRHPEHQAALVAYARDLGKPIVAIVNTHWHLDHSGGNAELLAAFPQAEVIATTAIEGALVGFLRPGRARSEAFVASGQATPEHIAEIEGDWAAVDAPGPLRATRPITTSGPIDLAGRTLDARVAPLAVSEADLWLVDAETRTVIAGDLVVAEVPFFDTACPTGWADALDAVAATPFDRLVPGHGATMTRAQFDTWHAAFDHLLACADSAAAADTCVAGWTRDAAAFIEPARADMVEEMLRYYLDAILRAPDARARFCAPLTAPG